MNKVGSEFATQPATPDQPEISEVAKEAPTPEIPEIVAVQEKVGALRALIDGLRDQLSEAQLEKMQASLSRLQRVAEEQINNLEYNATHDPLTGLYNRGAFYEKVSQRLQEPTVHTNNKRTESAGVMVFIDLNNLKKLNDMIGHLPTNEVLKQFTGLTERLRKSDIAGRLGGDEIVLFLPHADPELAAKVIGRYIYRMLNKKPIEVVDEHGKRVVVPVTCAVGVEAIPKDRVAAGMTIEEAEKLVEELITAAHMREKQAKIASQHTSIAVAYPGKDGEDIVVNEGELLNPASDSSKK
ncbi:MAG TPA: diguanylate cyclase [Patescibacteria group bacterium]|nr:diguanylate cyclase [Patescibacteria group bacterium]